MSRRTFECILSFPAAADWVMADAARQALEKVDFELAGVVRPLKAEEQGARLDCAVCLRRVVGRSDNWVVLPCKHGLCARCFTKLVAAQVWQ